MLVDLSSTRWWATLASPWSCRCNSVAQTQNLFSALTFLMRFKLQQDSQLLPIQPPVGGSNCQPIILKICVPALSCVNLPSRRLFFPSSALACIAHCGPDTVWLSCVLLFCVKVNRSHVNSILFLSIYWFTYKYSVRKKEMQATGAIISVVLHK